MFYCPDQSDSDGMQLFLVASHPEGQGSNFVQSPYTPSRDLIKVSFALYWSNNSKMCWSISQPSDKDGQLICTQLTTFNLFKQVNWLKQLALGLRTVLTISRYPIECFLFERGQTVTEFHSNRESFHCRWSQAPNVIELATDPNLTTLRPWNFHRRLIPCGRRQSILVLMGAVLMLFDLKLTRSIDLRQARSKQAESSSHLTGKSSPKPSSSGGNGNGKSGNAHSSSKNNQQSSKGKPQAASNLRNNKKNKSGQRLNQHDLIVTIDLVIQLSIHFHSFLALPFSCSISFARTSCHQYCQIWAFYSPQSPWLPPTCSCGPTSAGWHSTIRQLHVVTKRPSVLSGMKPWFRPFPSFTLPSHMAIISRPWYKSPNLWSYESPDMKRVETGVTEAFTAGHIYEPHARIAILRRIRDLYDRFIVGFFCWPSSRINHRRPLSRL